MIWLVVDDEDRAGVNLTEPLGATVMLRAKLFSIAAIILAASVADQATAGPAIQLLGKGVQIYHCSAASNAFTWVLTAPEAVLKDESGSVVVRHFAGPSWQAADGSTIIGEALSSSLSPEAGAISWLVLHVKSRSGPGRFASVAYVTRTATHGGLPPTEGCDGAHVGAESQIPYSATYTFFSGPTPPAP